MVDTVDGTVPSRQEVEQILASGADSETKRGLVLRYMDYVEDENPADYGFKDEDEFDEWCDRMKDEHHVSWRDMNQQNSPAEEVQNWYERGKEKLDADTRAGQAQAVDDAKGKLGALDGQASETSAGVGNSNEILDAGVPGLESIRIFMDVYHKARKFCPDGMPSYRYVEDILHRYDEQRHIPFDLFDAGAQEFIATREKLTTAFGAQDGSMQTVFANWEGQGSDAAYQSWEAMRGGAETVESALEDAADSIRRAAAFVAETCRQKAQWVLDVAFQEWPTAGGLSPHDFDRLIRVAELGVEVHDNDIKHFTRFMGSGEGSTGDAVSGDCGDLDDDTKEQAQKWAIQYLTDFCAWYSEHVANFVKVCDNSKRFVDESWNELGAHLNAAPQNVFAAVGNPAQSGADGGTAESSASSAGGTAQTPGAGSGGPPAGASPSPGAPPAAPAAPEMPQPPEAPELAAPPETPVAPEPPEPAPSPDTATDPLTGEASRPSTLDPAAGSSAPGGPDPATTTVRKGDTEIAMTPSGADTPGRIAVSDGAGEPREYALDFGTGDPAPPGGQPDAGPAAAVPDPAAPTGDGFGPQGAERPTDENGNTFTVDDNGERTFGPGPDGRIHIRDGALEFVAEQPDGPGGPTLVTVDDGTGETTAYTLDSPDAPVADGHGTDSAAAQPPADATDAPPAGGVPEPPPADGVPDELPPATEPPPSAGETPPPAGGGVPEGAVPSTEPRGFPAEPDRGAMSGDVGAPAEADDDRQATSPQAVGAAGAGVSGVAEPQVGAGALGANDAAMEADPPAGAPTPRQADSGAGLGSAPGGEDAVTSAEPVGAGMLGGAGAGGSTGGEDQQRPPSPFRIGEALFDTASATGRISGSLDDAPGSIGDLR